MAPACVKFALACSAFTTSLALRRSSKRNVHEHQRSVAQQTGRLGASQCDSTLVQRALIREQVFDEMAKTGYEVRNANGTVFCTRASESAPPNGGCTYAMNPPTENVSITDTFYQSYSSKDLMIWIGCTPPEGTWYFGCTHYLNAFSAWYPKRQSSKESAVPVHLGVLASMGDSLNQLNMRSSQPKFWDSTFVIITTADKNAAQAASKAVTKVAPWLAGAINLQVVPSQLSPKISMGLGRGHSVFTTGCRMAPGRSDQWGENRDRFAAWVDQREPLLYLSGQDSRMPGVPLATPAHRSRIGGKSEDAFKPDFDKLMCSIQQRAWLLGFALHTKTESHPVTVEANGEEFYINGTQCILVGAGNCIQDSQDALYTQAKVPLGDTDMQVFVGVNHRVAGMVRYGYVQWAFGSSVHDRQSEGSAIPWASNLSEPRHFIALISRATDGLCSELPADVAKWCTSDTSAEEGLITYNERAYLNLRTATGPDQSELLPSKVLRFRKRTPADVPRSC